MEAYSVLIIEDDKEINDMLQQVLRQDGYQAKGVYNGMDGLSEALRGHYHLILLDLTLPFQSGDMILRKLRLEKNTPVIVLSAKSLTGTKIDLLKLGADDYITKPFDIEEVSARVLSVLRRTGRQSEPERSLAFQDIRIDCASMRVYVCGQEVVFTAMEYKILELLLKHPDRIFSKRSLFELIMEESYISGDNTVNVHMSNIRKKLKTVSSRDYIETVYGMGYRLKN